MDDLHERTQKFLNDVKIVHGDFYSYERMNYINQYTKIEIICPTHGSFRQNPGQHRFGRGCNECHKDKKRLNVDAFIQRSKDIHGNKYTYEDILYKNSNTKITINCLEHGSFEQTPSSHLRGNGCPKCGMLTVANQRRKLTKDFIEESIITHGIFYDYCIANYIDCNEKVSIICPNHGVFEQIPFVHTRGSGCPDCGNEKISQRLTYSLEQFMEKVSLIHGEIYDYSKTEYKNSKEKITIICRKHGEFKQTPNDHLCNLGCPNCKKSKGEITIKNILEENRILFIPQKYFKDCLSDKYAKLFFDFYLPDLHTIIEYDGEQHEKPIAFWGGRDGFMGTIRRDFLKDEYCERNNIKMIRISYKDDILETLKMKNIIPY